MRESKLGIIVLEFLSLSTLRSGELVHLPLLELEAVCQLSKQVLRCGQLVLLRKDLLYSRSVWRLHGIFCVRCLHGIVCGSGPSPSARVQKIRSGKLIRAVSVFLRRLVSLYRAAMQYPSVCAALGAL